MLLGDSKKRSRRIIISVDRLLSRRLDLRLATRSEIGPFTRHDAGATGELTRCPDRSDDVPVSSLRRTRQALVPRAEAISERVIFSASLTATPPKPRNPPSFEASATLLAICSSQLL